MQGVVIGWGTTEQYGGSSDVLNEVKVPIMSNKECRMTPYGDKAITENMMCAGFPEGKKDACQVSISWEFVKRFEIQKLTLKNVLVLMGISNYLK